MHEPYLHTSEGRDPTASLFDKLSTTVLCRCGERAKDTRGTVVTDSISTG